VVEEMVAVTVVAVVVKMWGSEKKVLILPRPNPSWILDLE